MEDVIRVNCSQIEGDVINIRVMTKTGITAAFTYSNISDEKKLIREIKVSFPWGANATETIKAQRP